MEMAVSSSAFYGQGSALQVEAIESVIEIETHPDSWQYVHFKQVFEHEFGLITRTMRLDDDTCIDLKALALECEELGLRLDLSKNTKCLHKLARRYVGPQRMMFTTDGEGGGLFVMEAIAGRLVGAVDGRTKQRTPAHRRQKGRGKCK